MLFAGHVRGKLSPVRFRCVSFAVLLFQALWLNVIIPGHQRGIVQLQTTAAAPCPAFCCDNAAAKDGNPAAPEQRAKNCAICFFAAHVSLPPVFTFDHPPLGLLQRLRASRSDDLFARFVLLPFDSCGPPTLA